MNCAILQWVADQDDLALHLQAVLLRLVKLMDDDGRIRMAQAEIAPHVGLGARQTRQAIQDLVTAKALTRKRQGCIAKKGEKGVGKGRAPDLLSANLERHRDNGDSPPLSADLNDKGEAPPLPPISEQKRDNGDKGAPSPVSVKSADNGDNAATLPLSQIVDAEYVDNSPPHIEHADARAQLTLNNTTSELHSEKAETSFESVAHACAKPMPNGGGELDPDWTLTDEQRGFAHERGFLNGSCDELFGQFIDHCVTKGPRISTGWKSEWRKWVRNQVRFDTERARAPQKESSHDQRDRSTGAATRTGDVRRKRDPVFDSIFGGEPEDASPLDYGRVDSYACK